MSRGPRSARGRRGGSRRPGRGALVVAGVLLLISLSALSGTAAAQEDEDETSGGTQLELEVGVRERFRMGGGLPVTVSISGESALEGRLDVIVSGWAASDVSGRTTIDVEVPGGSTKDFRFVLPAPLGSEGDVRATLRVDGEEDTRETVPINAGAGIELVGVLPSLSAEVPEEGHLVLAMTDGRSYLDELDTSDWEATVVEAYGTLVASADDLEDLDQLWVSSIGHWLVHGGRLLVDEEPGTVTTLPAEWTADSHNDVGLGEVVMTDGQVAGGGLRFLIAPTPQMGFEDSWLITESLFGTTPLSSDLAYDAGVSEVPVIGLATALSVYTLVVAPLVFAILSLRRRRERAWVLIPALALVTSAGVYVVGEATSEKPAATHISLLETSETGARATVAAGSPGEGTLDAALPEGWGSAPHGFAGASDFFFGGPAGVDQRVVSDGDGTVLRSPLGAEPFGTLYAQGPTASPALTVEISATHPGVIEGTVTNETPYDLTDVVVFTGSDYVRVEDLPAGAKDEWELDEIDEQTMSGLGPDQRLWSDFDEEDLWSGSFSPSPPDPDEIPRGSLWAVVRALDTELVGTTAVVGAAGWTDEYEPELGTPSGGSGWSGRTVVTGYSTGNAAREGFQWRIVRDAASFPEADPEPGDLDDEDEDDDGIQFDEEWFNEVLVEFRLPDGISAQTAANLVIRPTDSSPTMSFWDGRRWRTESTAEGGDLLWLDPATGATQPGDVRGEAVRVPGWAVQGSTVWARVRTDSYDLSALRMTEIGT